MKINLGQPTQPSLEGGLERKGYRGHPGPRQGFPRLLVGEHPYKSFLGLIFRQVQHANAAGVRGVPANSL